MITFRRSLQRHRGPTRGTFGEYLRSYLDEVDPAYLSQVVTVLNQPFVKAREKSAPHVGPGKSVLPPGFPWITPVLGSGIVDPGLVKGGELLSNRLAGFDGALGAARLPDNRRCAEVARRFATALVADRLGTRPLAPAVDDPPPVALPVARLLLAVALLTELHERMMLRTGGPIPRWEEHDESPDRAPDPGDRSWDELRVRLVQPLEALLRALADETDALGGGVAAVLAGRLDEVTAGRITSLADLRLLTECAWFHLAVDTLTYPGWSDLMLRLAVDDAPIPHEDGRPRPLYTHVARSQERTKMQRLYLEPAERAWEARAEAGEERGSTLHDRIAEMLVRQARLQASNTGPDAVPLATAFVTGFDLELELALLAAKPAQPFVIAVPLLAAERPNDETFSMVWAGLIVEPAEAASGGVFGALANAQYVILSGADQFGRTRAQHQGLPIVVRLTGCPAITAPDLAQDRHREFHDAVCRLVGASPDAPPQLESLFVLDEYVASSLGTIESFLDHRDEARLGLPRWVAGTPGGVNNKFVRFWLVLGVQLNDRSIRQRIVAQLASTTITSIAAKVVPARNGLVINRRIGPLDGRIMEWHGFDIVQDECGPLARHVEHYNRHLDDATEGAGAIACKPAGCDLR